MWYEGFAIALQSHNLMYLLLGTIIGLVVGAMPGLGPLFGVGLMLPFTFGMPAATAIIFLAAVHASTVYGGSIASILIKTPGGVGSVAACWDGYPLAQQGKAGMALGISTTSSFIGGLIGWVSLVVISPLLILVALKMGPPEYFLVAIMALSLLAMASAGKVAAGLALGGIGLLLAFIGSDPITASSRLTFGADYLEDGLPLVPVAVGLFALSQAIVLAEKGGTISQIRSIGSIRQGIGETIRRPFTIMRGGIVGILLGVMPALGVSSANIVAYLVEKRASKNPETFGHGNPAGLVAPEVANNSCVVGDLIPTFTLGIPGSSTTALFIAAMTMHGIQPGVNFFKAGALPYAIFSGILFAQIAFFVLGLFFARYFAMTVLAPNAFIVPMIVFLSFMGSFAMRSRIEDVLVTIIFGFLGYILSKKNYPAICLLLAFVLGDITEANFHRSILIGRGSYLIFLSTTISIVLFILTILALIGPYLVSLGKKALAKERK
ncbi:MAG: tripartite tricarboxylate transporter permease [Thermodesulfobacteriota bacterium]|nr:tripartite tricarboxylate transporter permease [Thermodesulfobacteriota bacterium]